MTKAGDDIRTTLESIIRSLAGRSTPVDFQASLTDLGLDSLKTMDLVLTIEERFGIQITDDELTGENLRTAEALVRLIIRLRSG